MKEELKYPAYNSRFSIGGISCSKDSFVVNFKYEKIQILTVQDIVNGKLPNLPASKVEPIKAAEKKTISNATQGKLSF